ncbi:putative spindle pole body associated protein SnaD [Aspergillus foveolatus]|uniref:putative spindle pole body associated protein SnaD n=1 Tax=Aspergillus foveolatus TaxID=210207 RepID=UPI003CCCB548
MADTTSHDTVGASTLAAPYFSSSSPSPSEHPPIDSPDRLPSPVSSPGARSPSGSPPSHREASLERAALELDARLAQYTVDFSQFPSTHADDGLDEQQEIEDEPDKLSVVGGPEDFTANLERYLLGEDDSINQDNDDEDKDQGQPQEESKRETEPLQPHDKPARPDSGQSNQPAVEDEAELGEYSEFGLPDDMSTPSHFLRRNVAPTKDIAHLEDIEESPNDELSPAATPTVRKFKSQTNQDVKQADEDLRRQIAELTQAVKERDEQLERNRDRVIEAASAGEEVTHLRAELQRKTALLEDMQESHAERVIARRSSLNASEFRALQKQIADMQKDLHSRSSHADIDTERLETISLLRQQLSLTQEQLEKRNAVLDDTIASLKQVTVSKEQQLHEKDAEIDRLRSQVDAQRAEIERLETDVAETHREYRALEDQMVLLETKNRPLEEKNSTLEADLNRAQSQVTAQENALKAMAADLPTDTPGGTYSEILELIKDLGQPNTNRSTRPRDGSDQDHDLEQIYEELSKLRTESSERAATNKNLEAQLSRAHDQAAESQLLIQSIEAENNRLVRNTEELKSKLDKTLNELNHLRTEHSEAQETITRLQESQQAQAQAQIQQPSPPSTPHANPNTTSLSALEANHKAQITNLKTAHATALSTLRSAHADSTRKLRALLSAAEARETELRSLLEQEKEIHRNNEEKKDAEIQRLNSVIASKDETAAAMDLRIAKSVEKREREWERRVELLLKERERMGKALLWSWGEKEHPTTKAKGSISGSGKTAAVSSCETDKENIDDGKRRHGQGQPYRYKYVKKT